MLVQHVYVQALRAPHRLLPKNTELVGQRLHDISARVVGILVRRVDRVVEHAPKLPPFRPARQRLANWHAPSCTMRSSLKPQV
jgi:hypothetical protein